MRGDLRSLQANKSLVAIHWLPLFLREDEDEQHLQPYYKEPIPAQENLLGLDLSVICCNRVDTSKDSLTFYVLNVFLHH